MPVNRGGSLAFAVPHDRSKPGPLVPLAVATAVFLIYAITCFRNVCGGDSGELIAAAASGGAAHPPGYPLYTVLARLFTLVPVGSLASRVNLLSAMCAALAGAALFRAVSLWTRSALAGLVTASLFAFAPGIWRYAICAEVFALNNLFNAVLLLLAAHYAVNQARHIPRLAAFVLGLSLSNHHTILFTGVPLVLWAAWVGRRDLLRVREVALLSACFAAGLTPYAYLVFAGRTAAAVSWGDTATWAGFWTHVLRREYGTFQLATSGLGSEPSASGVVGAWLQFVWEQLGAWGTPLLFSGLVAAVLALRRRPRDLLGVVVLAPVLSVAVFALAGNLSVDDPVRREILARFWQQPYLFVCVLCGVAFAEGAKRVPWRVLPPLVCLGLVLLQPALHFREMDRHRSTLVQDYGAEILRAAPGGALMITRGDLITNSVRYLQVAERMRADVRVVDQELLGFPWGVRRARALYPSVTFPVSRYAQGASDGFSLRQLIDANVSSSPIVICGGTKPGDTSLEGVYQLLPLGLCDLVLPRSQPVLIDRWVRESDEALPRIEFAGQPRPRGSFEAIVWDDYWAARQWRAAQLLEMAGADPARRGLIELAVAALEEIVTAHPEASPVIYKSLAIAHGRLGLRTPGERARTLAVWRHYLAVAPHDDPQLPAIEEEVRRLSQ